MTKEAPLILVILDDEDMARFYTRFLKLYGYASLAASTAADARLMAAEHKPALFMLDLGLPDNAALPLCEELSKSTDAAILLVTDSGEVSVKVDGLRAGGDYCLAEPYDNDELLAVIRSLLRRTDLSLRKPPA